MKDYKILIEGDSSVLIVFGDTISPEINRRVTAAVQLIKEQRIEGIVDMIPAFASLLINYNPMVISYDSIRRRLERILKMDVRGEEGRKRVFEIPVCYGGRFGPDLDNIAAHAGLTPEEVVDIHSSRDYLIYMLGFLPGFCYLGGLDERLHTPRLTTPRVSIPAGSVGIAGSQTGIYPLNSPGGWQLIGQTPLRLYDPKREKAILVDAGMNMIFYPIDEAEYERIRRENYPEEYAKGGDQT